LTLLAHLDQDAFRRLVFSAHSANAISGKSASDEIRLNDAPANGMRSKIQCATSSFDKADNDLNVLPTASPVPVAGGWPSEPFSCFAVIRQRSAFQLVRSKHV